MKVEELDKETYSDSRKKTLLMIAVVKFFPLISKFWFNEFNITYIDIEKLENEAVMFQEDRSAVIPTMKTIIIDTTGVFRSEYLFYV